MNARWFLAPALGLTLAVSAGCGDQPLAPKLSLDRHTVPTDIVFGGVPITLDTYLWRDFMPISPPDGKPMIAAFTVRSTDGSPLPAGLAITGAGVYDQGESWVSVPVQQAGSDPTRALAVSRGGPKWGPGVTVDVIVTVSVGGRQRALLSAPDQLVRRTD